MTEITTEITNEVFEKIAKEKSVTFAYPHIEIVLNRK